MMIGRVATTTSTKMSTMSLFFFIWHNKLYIPPTNCRGGVRLYCELGGLMFLGAKLALNFAIVFQSLTLHLFFRRIAYF